MAERSMAVVLKTTVRETVPGVRIPLPPPTFALACLAEGDGLQGIKQRAIAPFRGPPLEPASAFRFMTWCVAALFEYVLLQLVIDGLVRLFVDPNTAV
jgi:hypothetical protein